MDGHQLVIKLQIAEKYFTSEQYQTLVSLAKNKFNAGNFQACKEMVAKFPTEESLLNDLIEKLEGKSIYRTLEKIHRGDSIGPLVKLKGISSLVTHTVIEMEKGNAEFGLLLPSLLEKAQALLFEV